MKISVIIPCYNEEKTILEILTKVNNQKKKFNLEIIICDDGSNDKTISIIEKHNDLCDKLIKLEQNSGKGSALQKAITQCTGDIILIQDADLEYDPNDYEKIIDPFITKNADVVYGSRFQGSAAHRLIYFSHRVANFFLTLLANIMTNINFSDVETGYKAFKSEVLKNIILKEKSFGIEIEITMKIAKLKVKIYEVGISYNGRTYAEGKKITIKDGFMAVFLIFKYFFSPAHRWLLMKQKKY
jgi:glycosyltransferase involved in cell wall biosynthesis